MIVRLPAGARGDDAPRLTLAGSGADDPPLCRQRDLERLLEAALFLGREPVSVFSVADAFPAIPPVAVERALRRLTHRYRRERRPYGILVSADAETGLARYELRVLPRYQERVLARTRPERAVKLPRPAVEALAVVAYRQPVTADDIEAMTKVDPRPMLRQLMRRGLVYLVPPPDSDPQADPPRKLRHYATTERFLSLFGLENLADLPTSPDFGLAEEEEVPASLEETAGPASDAAS